MSDSVFTTLHESAKQLNESEQSVDGNIPQGAFHAAVRSDPPIPRPQNGTKGFRVTYEIVTPESAENGEAAESGFLDEEGVCMDPEPGEAEDGLVTAVDNALKYLRGEGATEWSGGSAAHGRWTATGWDIDYSTGAEESRGFHPYGFTPEEIDVINAGLKR